MGSHRHPGKNRNGNETIDQHKERPNWALRKSAEQVREPEPPHHKTPDMMAKIKSNQMSCMSSNCHDVIHNIDDLKDVTFWKGTQ
ncbi:MAG: hypothetical protein ACRD2B_16855 [Terriglobia bacterium]